MFCNNGLSPYDKIVADHLPHNYTQQINKQTYPSLTDWSLGMLPYARACKPENYEGTEDMLQPGGHPNATAHEVYANYLADRIKELYI